MLKVNEQMQVAQLPPLYVEHSLFLQDTLVQKVVCDHLTYRPSEGASVNLYVK